MSAKNSPNQIEADHRFLCHPNGEACPDGCDAPADPKRLAEYEADDKKVSNLAMAIWLEAEWEIFCWCTCQDARCTREEFAEEMSLT